MFCRQFVQIWQTTVKCKIDVCVQRRSSKVNEPYSHSRNSVVPVHSCTRSFQRACFGSSSPVTLALTKEWLSCKPGDEGVIFAIAPISGGCVVGNMKRKGMA
ncbi:hypothetical protein AVEN_73391-1 [Araneus ventricosus]|uniref:Uncharacterized protein n=1 Tax=Araneus ventricosus TaxID=182803 RepID=A0A4Y2PBA4_ARAVE|nr:hypothetical protein AVEN_73391-1 [Araneus ventricosus]